MARLPQPGQDAGAWGGILNEFLQVSHSADGKLKNQYINVMDYGAKGDNVTDDAPAIQAAIAASGWPQKQAAIFIPPGKYRVNTTILIDGQGKTSTPPLIISGYGAILYTEKAGHLLVDVTNSVLTLTRVAFYGLRFFPNARGCTCVRMKNAEFCEFVSCEFGGSFSTGIEFIGIGTQNGTSHSNRIIACGFVNLARGILINSDANYLQIESCQFSEQLVGDPLNWIEAGGTIKMLRINNCTFYGTGATLPVIRTTNAYQTSIVGCSFMECDNTAIELGNNGSSFGGGNSVIGCKFQLIAGNGITIKGTYNTISNNHFQTISASSNKRPGAKTSDAILIDAGSANVITGNTASDAVNTRYFVNEINGANKNIIMGNIMKTGITINKTGANSIDVNNLAV